MANKFSKENTFTSLKTGEQKNTLAHKLIPVADRLRDLHTKFGGRTYKVKIIRTKWSGGRRGIGEEYVTSELIILPTPLVVDLSSLQEVLTPVGLNEVGSVQINEISGRFSEEQLRGLDSNGVEIPNDEQVYYEIEFPRIRDGKSPIRRRFIISQAPNYSPYSFQWRITLSKVDEDRNALGETQG